MQNSYSNENYAGFWVRLAAYVIDSVIVAIGLLVVRLAWIGIGALISGTILDENVLFHYSLKDIVLYIFKVMYFALLTWCTGTTIGKRLMNLRVVPADRNEKLSFVDVLYRETVGRFLCGISIWIGYIIVGIDKEKRGFQRQLYQYCIEFLGPHASHCVFDVSTHEKIYDIGLLYCDAFAK